MLWNPYVEYLKVVVIDYEHFETLVTANPRYTRTFWTISGSKTTDNIGNRGYQGILFKEES